MNIEQEEQEEDEEEEEEEAFLLALAVATRKKKRRHRWWVHPILQNRNQHGVYHHLGPRTAAPRRKISRILSPI